MDNTQCIYLSDSRTVFGTIHIQNSEFRNQPINGFYLYIDVRDNINIIMSKFSQYSIKTLPASTFNLGIDNNNTQLIITKSEIKF